MKKIEFRAKRKSDGEWVYGTPIEIYNKFVMANSFMVLGQDVTGANEDAGSILDEINPETIGQFTGMLDKNGKKIFEGDIVRFENKKTYRVLGAIWDDIGSTNRYVLELYRPDAFNPICICYCENGTDFEVLGNIYDNPELLEKEEEE